MSCVDIPAGNSPIIDEIMEQMLSISSIISSINPPPRRCPGGDVRRQVFIGGRPFVRGSSVANQFHCVGKERDLARHSLSRTFPRLCVAIPARSRTLDGVLDPLVMEYDPHDPMGQRAIRIPPSKAEDPNDPMGQRAIRIPPSTAEDPTAAVAGELTISAVNPPLSGEATATGAVDPSRGRSVVRG